MKKTKAVFLILLFLGVCFTGFAQSTSETNELGYILFAPDSTEFENYIEAKDLLDQYAKNISEISSKNKQIHINGYTAIFENDIDPVKLSYDRANIVLRELVTRGVPAERFDIAKGNGGTENWGNNTESEYRKPNRRVTISIDILKEIPQIADIQNSEPEPEVKENIIANNVKKEKPASNINWKKVIIRVAIVIAIIAAIILIIVFWPEICAFFGAFFGGVGAGAGTVGTAGAGVAGGAKAGSAVARAAKAARAAAKAKKAARAAKVSTKFARVAEKVKPILQQGAEKVFRGGRHGDLPVPEGIERHHMPPWNSFPVDMKNVKYGELPSIQMEKIDHMKTLGYSGRKELDELAKLMDKGKYWKVVKKCVKDVKTQFPGKYDAAIKEFLIEAKKYRKVFLKNLKVLKL
jgi:hypothetical protein